MLFACGDIELNPGPKKRSSCYDFSVCHWNLNSITAHDFAKIDLLQAYNTIKQYDMICLCVCVCVYFKESLPVRCLSNSYLKECLILKVSIDNKRSYFVSLYRSPSQTSDEFDSFITNLEKVVVDISGSNPHFLLLIG